MDKTFSGNGNQTRALAINPIASSQSSSFSLHFMNDYFRTRKLKENCQKIESDRKFPSSSMGRMLEIRNYNMESIKKTMQMHEDMFKHQVQELHRLYSVQKVLMDELKKEIKTNRLWATSVTTSDINQSQLINHQHFTTQVTCGYNSHVEADPSTRQRSGSCCSDHIHTMKMIRNLDLERLVGEDNSAEGEEAIAVEEDQAGSSSLMNSTVNQMIIEGSDEYSEVELTLSIGSGGSSSEKKMAKNSKSEPHNQSKGKEIREIDSSASFKSEMVEDFSGHNTPISTFSSTFDREIKRPPWLFHGLSINRT